MKSLNHVDLRVETYSAWVATLIVLKGSQQNESQ